MFLLYHKLVKKELISGLLTFFLAKVTVTKKCLNIYYLLEGIQIIDVCGGQI